MCKIFILDNVSETVAYVSVVLMLSMFDVRKCFNSRMCWLYRIVTIEVSGVLVAFSLEYFFIP